ncbi:hypothetical protein [Conexibacter woesei]|nr:hypothetical protein [Conexibacter woesei]
MVRRTQRSAAQLATSRVVDAEVDRVIEGDEPRFGNPASFIPSDLLTSEGIAEAHGRGCTVVIVDADENVRVLPVPE